MDDTITSVHISKILSSSLIVDLMEEYPNLSEITCPPSIYKRTSKNYIDALLQLDINVKIKYNRGSKSKTNGAEFEVLELCNEGLKPKEIAQKLDISLNRVYYLLNKVNAKFDNRKRKYDYNNIINLKKEGLSAREISQKLDMPIRSVYYILNKK